MAGDGVGIGGGPSGLVGIVDGTAHRQTQRVQILLSFTPDGAESGNIGVISTIFARHRLIMKAGKAGLNISRDL